MNKERLIRTYINGELVIIYPDRKVNINKLPIKKSDPEPTVDQIFDVPVYRKLYMIGEDLRLTPHNVTINSGLREHIKRKKIFDTIRAAHVAMVISYEGIIAALAYDDLNIEFGLDEVIQFGYKAAKFNRKSPQDMSSVLIGFTKYMYPELSDDTSPDQIVRSTALAALGITRSIVVEDIGTYCSVQTALKRVFQDPVASRLFTIYPELFNTEYIIGAESKDKNLANNHWGYWSQINTP